MLKLLSVGLVYDNIHKHFLVVREPEDRHWRLPQSMVEPGQHPALALSTFIQNATSVATQPQYLGHTIPGNEDDEWQRLYWFCLANGGEPKVVKSNKPGITAAEYVDRLTILGRLSERMPAPFASLLHNIC